MRKQTHPKVGEQYGELTILKDLGSRPQWGSLVHFWWCRCSCGNELERTTFQLTHQKSCGCLREVNQFKSRSNKYDLSGDYGIGYTSKGEEFYFDLEDYDAIKDYCWYFDRQGYVMTTKHGDKKEGIIMHRLIMNCPKDKDIDHINHIKYDNRRKNLRIVTTEQNMHNTITTNPYGANGIRKTPSGKYSACIGLNGETKKNRHI